MPRMGDGFHWLVGDDSPLSIFANAIAVGTFIIGIFGVRFANRTRRELREIRRRLPKGDPISDRETLQSIKLLRRVDEGDNQRWHVVWSDLGASAPDALKGDVAVIKSRHLLSELEKRPNRIDMSKEAIVVGSVAYADHGGGVYSSVAVRTVHHIDGDHPIRLVWYALRLAMGRLLAEIG